jgi:hypothetical protein
MRRAAVVTALVLAGAARARGAGDDPSLKDVLRRMAAYVEAYGEKASIVVATERYAQHVSAGERAQDRHTVADFAIVRAAGFGGWVGFRDVVEADGARLANRADRLLEILSDVAGRLDEAQRLSDESARFNIGPIFRNFNVPTAALFFFRPESLERFKFSRKSVDDRGTWEIAFRETAHPTIIRTPEGRSVPLEGRLWVNAADGTVLRTRIQMKEFARGRSASRRDAGNAQVDVTYARVLAVGMWLPETMTESYEVVRAGRLERITTEARYSEYRVFQTSVRIK